MARLRRSTPEVIPTPTRILPASTTATLPTAPQQFPPVQMLPTGGTTRGEAPSGSIRPKLSLRDLLSEATAGLLARPGRLMLTALGTVLGIAALVATLGIAKTTGQQIQNTFNELDATKVTARPRSSGGFGGGRNTASTIPFDAEKRMLRINGVVAAGTKSDVDVGVELTRSLPVTNAVNGDGFSIPVIATSPGLFEAVRGTMATGRYFDTGHNEREDPVAVLGPRAADKLEITRVDNLPTIFIGEKPYSVLGIIDDVVREPDLLSAIIIPDLTAKKVYDLRAPRELHIDTEIGAARQVGEAVALTLDPIDPSRIRTTAPPKPEFLRNSVEDSVNALFVILGGVSLLVGALGIANVTLVSVLERTSEIGLRRALGAAKRHIAMQFLLESTATGLLGGLVGSSIGMIITVAVSANQEWTPVLDTWLPFAAVGLGALIGLLAGTYPSLRAARIEPIAALRGTG